MFDVYHSANQGNWRISIGRAGRRTLVVLGLHPGLADADDEVELAEKVALANGCDGFVSMNLCPIRAADVYGLPSAIEDLAYTNVDEVVRFVSKLASPRKIVARCQGAGARDYLERSFAEIQDRLAPHDVQWIEA